MKKLTFNELISSHEILNSEQMSEILGGTGGIVSGSGTLSSPYVVKATYYCVGSDAYSYGQQAANDFNAGADLGVAPVQGMYYKYEITVVQKATEAEAQIAAKADIHMKADGSKFQLGNVIKTGSVPNSGATTTWGTSDPNTNTITVDLNKINNYYSANSGTFGGGGSGGSGVGSLGLAKGEFATVVMQHEMGHSLGLEHSGTGAMQNVTELRDQNGTLIGISGGSINSDNLKEIIRTIQSLNGGGTAVSSGNKTYK